AEKADKGQRHLNRSRRRHLRGRHHQLRDARQQKHGGEQALHDPESGVSLHVAYFFAAATDWARMRFSCSRISGVIASPKSSVSKTRRISISIPPPNGARLIQAIASSMDFTCHNQKPATSSFDSGNGRSMTVGALPEKLTRFPLDVGCRPSPANSTPAWTSSSLNAPISGRIFV